MALEPQDQRNGLLSQFILSLATETWSFRDTVSVSVQQGMSFEGLWKVSIRSHNLYVGRRVVKLTYVLFRANVKFTYD